MGFLRADIRRMLVFMGLLPGEWLVIKFFIWKIGTIIIVNSQDG